MQQGWRQADQKAGWPLVFRCALQPEVVVEARPIRHEIEHRGPHAKGDGEGNGDAARAAGVVHQAARVKNEVIKAVHIEVDTVQKRVDVVRLHAFVEHPDVEFGIDVARQSGHDLRLGLADAAHAGAGLAIEVDQVELVEVGHMEVADSQPCQSQKMNPAGAAQTGNGDLFATQRLLLVRGEPAKVTAEGLVVIERPHNRASGFFFE